MRYIDSESESENSLYLFNNSRTEKDSFENQIKNFPVDKMLKIFEDKKPEEEIDETPIKTNEGENNEIITSPTPEERRTNLFIVSISDATNDTSQLSKKRGRKTNQMEEKEKIMINFRLII